MNASGVGPIVGPPFNILAFGQGFNVRPGPHDFFTSRTRRSCFSEFRVFSCQNSTWYKSKLRHQFCYGNAI
jgi:hypothetical protein